MKISVLYTDDSGCDYHRLLMPTYNMPLSDDDYISYFKHSDILKDEAIYHCDILYVSRMFYVDFSTIDYMRKKYGFKVVMDIDDYYKLPYNHLYYKDWEHNQISGRIEQTCKHSDYVIVTNELLYDVYHPINNNISIIKNSLPFGKDQFIPEPAISDKLRFMYVSGTSHLDDIKSIRGFLKRIGGDQEFIKNAEFILCGYTNPTNNKNSVWNAIESIAKTSKSYVRREGMSLNTYMDHYNHGDVAIAPLEDTFFNNCKSNLKFLEAACMKKPFICTNTLPYTHDKGKTKGIIYCDSSKEWYEAFKFFIKNRNAVEDYGYLNYEYALKEYNIDDANVQRINIFKSLLN